MELRFLGSIIFGHAICVSTPWKMDGVSKKWQEERSGQEVWATKMALSALDSCSLGSYNNLGGAC